MGVLKAALETGQRCGFQAVSAILAAQQPSQPAASNIFRAAILMV